MRRRLSALAITALMVLALVPAMASADPVPEMKITGVIDGPLSGGVPKAIEVTAVTAIDDLSQFGLGSANNGGGTDGQEFTFPAASLNAGDVVYVASESTGFTAFFGFAPAYTSGAASINGDDAIELFHDGGVIDVFGDIDTDGNGEPWEYLDGWAKRIAGGPDGSTFVLANWSYSGPDALDGETTNASAANPYPVETQAVPGPPIVPPPTGYFIHEIQGSGDSSPLAGENVRIEAVVTATHEGSNYRGFFVQEEDADVDADAATSEGLFVYTGYSPAGVSVGDLVQVDGQVVEYDDLTEISQPSQVVVVSSANTLPTPASPLPQVSHSGWEHVEGMLVTLPDGMVVSEYFNFDRFGELVVGLPMSGEGRLYQPTAVHDPATPEAEARRDWNVANQITVDDGQTFQNPWYPTHPINGEDFTRTNYFRGGDVVDGLTGVVTFTESGGYSWAASYKLLATGYDAYTPNPRPSTPDVGGRLTAVSFNALNYFLTTDGSGSICGPDLDQDCRGADNAFELDRQRAKTLRAMIEMDADLFGIQEVENTTGVHPLADLVAGLNDHFGEDTYAYVDAGVPGPDVIKVGIIYRRTALTQIGETAILDSDEFIDPLGVGRPLNRAAVAASFLEKGTGEKFSVVVNHLKSKGSGCGAGDDDPWAGSCNASRAAAAQVLADWLDTNPTDSKDADWLILGDLNSYDQEEPIDVLRDAGYTDLVGHFGGEFAYSYLFSAELGYLDYAMASENLVGQVTGTAVWHSNADEADVFDYDTSFKSNNQDALFDATNPYRSSDHDPVIVGLDLDEKPGKGNKGKNK